MLGHRLRRWPNIKSALDQLLVFAGKKLYGSLRVSLLYDYSRFYSVLLEIKSMLLPLLRQERYNMCWSFQQTQNICMTFVQCRTNVEDVEPTLYKMPYTCFVFAGLFVGMSLSLSVGFLKK